MGILTPVALILLPLLAAIIALYFLRLRRQETEVSSLFLWQSLLRDREANAPWQRLRASLLLLLQLAIALGLILALARPWSSAALEGGRNLVVILDVSASMASTDGAGGVSRLEEARREAWRRIEALPSNGTAAVILASSRAEVLAPATTDRALLKRLLDGVAVRAAGTDLTEALALASSLASGFPDCEVLILSDGVFPDPRAAVKSIDALLTFQPMGSRGENQGIVALGVERSAGALGLFVQVLNAGDETVERRLDVELDGVAWSGRRLLLTPGETQQLVLEDLPLTARVARARLAGSDENALDDEAWTINRLAEPAQVLMVTDGNRFLQNALVLLPNVRLLRTARADFAPVPTATLTVLDGIVPTSTLPSGNLLFINPPAGSDLFEVTGVITNPVPLAAGATADEPLLRHTDLGGVHISHARAVPQPDWGHVVLESDQGPLLVAGTVEGRRVVVIAFDLHDSDLPLQISFPLLIRNLVGYLLPEPAGGLPISVPAGEPVSLSADLQAGAGRLTVEGPDGELLGQYPVSAAQPRVTFAATEKPGLYVVSQWIGDQELRRDGFTVNLFSAEESYTLPVLAPPLPASLAASPPAGAPADATEPGRWEWWQWLAALALAALVAEWLAVHSMAVRRALASLAALRDRLIPARGKGAA